MATGGDAVTAVKGALNATAGSPLRAWLQHFDRNGDDRISWREFCDGLKELNYEGDIVKLWNEIDEDGSGEITLEEIDQESNEVWLSFRRWCAMTFQNGRDMLQMLTGGMLGKVGTNHFTENCRQLGWRGGFEEVLFSALDRHAHGFLTLDDCKFVDRERKKLARKETAKAKANFMQTKRSRARLASARAITDFRRFLKRRHGNIVRAWLSVIDLDKSMSVQQKELFKACARMGWNGDVRALWRALDSDDSGVAGLEELDALSAQVLARFKELCDTKFGGCKLAFRAFDRHGIKRLRPPEFVAEARRLGFDKGAYIYHGVNVQAKKFITENEFEFLEHWRPPKWLTVEADYAAADEVKSQLLKRYKHLVKAWRKVLDRDSSNRVSWHEFEHGCHKLGFYGNVAGAWRAFDADLSGYIQLKEIDSDAHHILSNFKIWADREFGGVRSGFRVLDADGSEELTFREFRRAVRDFGFDADPKEFFTALGTDLNGRLTVEEVAFLDAWEIDDMDKILEEDEGEGDGSRSRAEGDARTKLLQFSTIGPGPAAYDLPDLLGEKAAAVAKNNGIFSLRRRGRSMWDGPHPARASTPEPGPAHYHPTPPVERGSQAPRETAGPAWGFSRGRRTSIVSTAYANPGPGTYKVDGETGTGRSFHSPAYSMVPRRGGTLHPQHKFNTRLYEEIRESAKAW